MALDKTIEMLKSLQTTDRQQWQMQSECNNLYNTVELKMLPSKQLPLLLVISFLNDWRQIEQLVKILMFYEKIKMEYKTTVMNLRERIQSSTMTTWAINFRKKMVLRQEQSTSE